MSDDFITFKGYCNAEHMLESGQRVGAVKTSILNITWILKNNRSEVTHVRFCDLTVTNLKTGVPVSIKNADSPAIPVSPLSTLDDTEDMIDGAVWIIDKNESPVNKMEEFVDYRISGSAVELSDDKEINKVKFQLFLMRDYKSVSRASIKDVNNWTVGPAALISKVGNPIVYLRDTTYDDKLGRILTIYNYGNLSIGNGEIIFYEIPDKREAFYLEMTNEEYKWVNGTLKRFWGYKKQSADRSPYEYKNIYERGFKK